MNKQLSKMIAAQIKTSYIAEAQSNVPQEDGLGLLISKHFEWDGLAILKVASAALEDANFHTENQVIAEMIKKLESQTAVA